MSGSNNLRLYGMLELLDRLGVQYTTSSDTAKIRGCPFCKRERAIVNINLSDDSWRCPACGQAGYPLNFFALYHLGCELSAYSSPSEKSRIGKALWEFMEGPNSTPHTTKTYERPEVVTIPVAPDYVLDTVYRTMAQIPELALTEDHRNNLRKRGLSDEAIDRNGYRSIPKHLSVDSYYQKLYNLAGGESRRKKELKNLRADQIQFGLMIAHRIISQNLSVEGVPGFYRFGTYWCYWCSISGILIPTRNIAGQIVIWQVRSDAPPRGKGTRYLTVSRRELPGHVTDSVSRCHFPLGNAPLSANTPLLITEGPLKADVACHLFGSPVAFAAIPGIQTTTDFLSHVVIFHTIGVREIYNALDMDRLTNPNVRRGCSSLREHLLHYGICLIERNWGERYAVSKLTELALVAKVKKIPYPTNGCNLFEQLDFIAGCLSEHDIPTCSYTDRSGEIVTDHWDPSTKGIDDYLLSCR